MRSRIIVFLFLISLPTVFAFTQNTANFFTSELNIKFDALEIKKLERAAKMVSDAEAIMAEARKDFESLSEVEKKG